MLILLLRIFTIWSFSKSLDFNSKGPIKCVSLNNQPCKARSAFVNINSDETLYSTKIHLLLVLISVVDVVEAAALLMIHILEFVFQIN